jgi:hypothetical protein
VSRPRRTSFIVRVVRTRRGKVSGVIERVGTGAKEAFQGVDAIGPVIARMVQREAAVRPAAPASQHVSGEKPYARRASPTRG